MEGHEQSYELAERFQYHGELEREETCINVPEGMSATEIPRQLPACPCGLRNLGNTCYMNSVLQCLSHTTQLREFFTGREATRSPYKEYINRNNPDGTGGVLAEVYGDLMERMCCGTDIIVQPEELKGAIGRYSPERRFAGYSQQDAQELLTFLLDGLHEDLNRVQGEKPYVDMTLDEDFVGGDDEVAKELWNKHLIRHDSKIVDLFHGQIRYQVECSECHQVIKSFETMTQLTLPIPTSNAVALEVDNWVDLSTCLELLSGEKPGNECDWVCTKCCKLVRPVREAEIWKTPPILIMHLKRFNTSSPCSHKKVNTPVDYPLSLSLAKFSANKEQQDAQYELYAVINHRGTLHSGHYTAFVKHDGSWYCCDDGIVQTMTEIVSDAAYVLFYQEMVKHKELPCQSNHSITMKHVVPPITVRHVSSWCGSLVSAWPAAYMLFYQEMVKHKELPCQSSHPITTKHVVPPSHLIPVRHVRSHKSRLRFCLIIVVVGSIFVFSWLCKCASVGVL